MISKRNKLEKIIFEKGYTIDDDGNVYNPNGIKLSLTSQNGYPAVSIKCKQIGYSDTKRVKVSRLQAYKQFGDKIYEDNIVVRHLDGNRENNSVTNISIGTQQDNVFDIPEKDRKAKSILGAKVIRKYDDAFVEKIREERKSGKSYKQIMFDYSLSKSTLHYILNNDYVAK